MGIVFGKPENHNKSKGVVRRNVNTRRNNKPTRSKKSTNNNNRKEPNRKEEEEEKEEEKEEMPEEFKAAMEEAGLDPDDSADVEKFLKSLNQDGGKRRTKHKRKYRELPY